MAEIQMPAFPHRLARSVKRGPLKDMERFRTSTQLINDSPVNIGYPFYVTTGWAASLVNTGPFDNWVY